MRMTHITRSLLVIRENIQPILFQLNQLVMERLVVTPETIDSSEFIKKVGTPGPEKAVQKNSP